MHQAHSMLRALLDYPDYVELFALLSFVGAFVAHMTGSTPMFLAMTACLYWLALSESEPEPCMVSQYHLPDLRADVYDFVVDNQRVLYGAVGLIVVYLVRRALYRGALKCSLTMRGVRRITPEAMRMGSTFEVTPIPSFQIAVKEVGVFSNGHVGYGIRVGNIFVVPRHVLYAAGWPVKTLAIESAGGREVFLEGRMEESRQFDLAYFFLTDGQWAMIGARSATLLKKSVQDCRVSCTGFSGKSRGVLRKTNMVGQYSYDGSTKAGYSGAAYYAADLGVVGIHVGVDGESNVGISSALIARELNSLTFAESKRNRGVTGLAAYDNPVEFMDPIKKWEDEDIDEVLFAAREGDDTAADWLEKNQDKHGVHRYKWEAISKNLQPEHLVMFQNVFNQVFNELQGEECQCKSLRHTCSAKKGKVNVTETVVGQSDEPQLAPQGLPTMEIVRETLMEMILDNSDKISSVEQAVETLVDNQNQVIGRIEDCEDHGLRALGEADNLDQRVQSLELWAIDRGYATLPPFLEEGSPQVEALKNRKKTTPDVPKAERVLGMKLTSRYVAESSGRRVVTPPLVRKLKKAVRPDPIPVPREVEMDLLKTRTPIPKEVTLESLMEKESLSDEERGWLTRILRYRKNKNRRKNKAQKVKFEIREKRLQPSTSSCVTTSTSAGKSEQSTSSPADQSSVPGPSTSQS